MSAFKSMLRRVEDSGVPLLVVRVVLGGLFVWMAAAKIGHPIDFLKQIRLYHMVPESPGILLNSIAVALPWIEIFAGAALVLGVFRRGGAAAIAIMLLVFTPAILMRALEIRATQGTAFFEIAFDCGCGSGVVIIWKKLLANSGLLLMSLYTLFSRSPRFSLACWIQRRRTATECADALGVPSASCDG
ncbi:MAG: DoxX family membrane protein [Phycisphaerales bacterium]|nr:MAG: DoxX family membrane protein [Phycisphaerales bacterium]